MTRANTVFARKAATLSLPLIAYFLASVFHLQLWGEILSPVSALTAAGILLFSYMRANKRNVISITFLFYFLACLVWGIADIIWCIAGVAGIDPKASPIIWVIYAFTNCFLLLALLIFSYHQFSKWNFVQVCVDSIFIGLMCAYFIWIVYMGKNVSILLTMLESDFTSIFSLICDVIICVSIFLWFLSIRSGNIPICLKMIATGILIFAVTDMIYYYIDYRGLYVPNSIIDFFYVLSFYIIALGGLWKTYKNKFTIDLKTIKNVGTRKTERYLVALPIIALLIHVLSLAEINLDYVDVAVFAFFIFFYKAVIKYVQLSIENEKLLKLEISNNEILERRVAEQVKELAFLANQDTLTSLYNRRYFMNDLDECIHAMRPHDTLALLLLDMDRFKIINDSYGHDTGDKVLVELASRMISWNYYGATMARLGGDEFGITFAGKYTHKDIDNFCRQIIALCSKPVLVGDNVLDISISIGVALFSREAGDATLLMKNADIAMYQAKSQGYNRYQFFDSILSFDIINSNKIELLLKQANIERDFELFYQPQFSLPGKKLVGAEALIRWNTSEHGYIPPNLFIPVAEKIEHISKIGKWVIKESIRQAIAWNQTRQMHVKVGINISPKQLNEDGFIDILRTMILESGVVTAWLDTEITEGTMLNEEDKVRKLFDMLKSMGVSISIDDFGSGYSALNYLNKYPFDRIKIDKSLIDNVSSSNKSGTNIVKSIIGMAKSIGITTIAEGVENQEQIDILSEIGCDQVQGYLLGRPVPAKYFEERFMNNRSPEIVEEKQINC